MNNIYIYIHTHTHTHTHTHIYSNKKIRWKQDSYTIYFQQIFILPKFWKSWDFFSREFIKPSKGREAPSNQWYYMEKKGKIQINLINVGEDLQ